MQSGTYRELCYKGLHKMTLENVYTAPKSGLRYCRACRKETRKGRSMTRIADDYKLPILQKLLLFVPKTTVEPFLMACFRRSQEPVSVIEKLLLGYASGSIEITENNT